MILYRVDVYGNQRLRALDEERKAHLKKPRIEASNAWKSFDLSECRFVLKENNTFPPETRLIFKRDCTLSEIFCYFMTEELLLAIWNNGMPDMWTYGEMTRKKKINQGQFSLKLLYKFFAIYVFIVGEQNGPTEAAKNDRPLCRNIESARYHLMTNFQQTICPGVKVIEVLIARFHVDAKLFPVLSKHFQSVCKTIGHFVAGDEKLLHFSGNSGDIRLVPSKPDHVGLWFYELCGYLSNGKPFLPTLLLK